MMARTKFNPARLAAGAFCCVCVPPDADRSVFRHNPNHKRY